ncbi:MAG: hypothetical protein ACEQSF_01075 [Solirubrobacteraceae bacterium]
MRGPGGEFAAEKISNLREIWDQNIKGYPRWDSMLDQKANTYGRSQGIFYRNQTGSCSLSETIPLYRKSYFPSNY